MLSSCFYLSFCQSLTLPSSLCLYVSVYQSLFSFLFLSLSLYVYLALSLSLSMSLSLSLYLSLTPSIHSLCVPPLVKVFSLACSLLSALSSSLSLYLSISLPLSLSISFYPPLTVRPLVSFFGNALLFWRLRGCQTSSQTGYYQQIILRN